MIDPATCWFEIAKAKYKLAMSIRDLFHNTWLMHYPRPRLLSLTMEANSNVSLSNFVRTTSHNPHANSIIERVHQVVNEMLRSFDLEKETLKEDNPFDYFLQSTSWAIRSTYHTTLQATHCQLVFGRDMIHNIAFKANWN
jgi:hypothetical protein